MYEYDMDDNGYDSFFDFSKTESKKATDRNAQSVIKTIESVHEQDELADAKMREEAKEQTKNRKPHPLTSVWQAVAENEEEYSL